jgi:hypothetical protein
MKLLLFTKDYNTDYDPDRSRTDDLRMLGIFLIEKGWDPYLMEWVQSSGCDEVTINYIFCIEKTNGRIKIYYPEVEKPLLDIIYEPFYEWSSKLVQLASDFYEMIDTISPLEIALFYEQEIYSLKPLFSSSIAFRKLTLSEQASYNEEYGTQGFARSSTIAALGYFLISNSSFISIKKWLTSNEGEFSFCSGTLNKKNKVVTITYTFPELERTYTTEINQDILFKIIEYYEQYTAQKLEAFLLIQEVEHYSFMINPYEEIKIFPT